ncbi:hypothetical protein TNCV_1285571 [Trichonephila clavipes]|uniref:Uncharacterized protein n=1 Tax=Trichonephila clavipes TaxID=2585209 RepID=A0A8X6SV48_TRICX|nr:hypothetical protein TNCV_1285571 [Trichonephila clavipes]
MEVSNVRKTHMSSSILFIYLSNTHAWLLDHLTSSLSVSTDDAVSRVSIESSALEKVVAIHSGIAADCQLADMSSQWRYIPIKSCPVVRRKRATASALSRCLGIRHTVARA